jgi:hypothetical protein
MKKSRLLLNAPRAPLFQLSAPFWNKSPYSDWWMIPREIWFEATAWASVSCVWVCLGFIKQSETMSTQKTIYSYTVGIIFHHFSLSQNMISDIEVNTNTDRTGTGTLYLSMIHNIFITNKRQVFLFCEFFFRSFECKYPSCLFFCILILPFFN